VRERPWTQQSEGHACEMGRSPKIWRCALFRKFIAGKPALGLGGACTILLITRFFDCANTWHHVSASLFHIYNISSTNYVDFVSAMLENSVTFWANIFQYSATGERTAIWQHSH